MTFNISEFHFPLLQNGKYIIHLIEILGEFKLLKATMFPLYAIFFFLMFFHVFLPTFSHIEF